VPPARFSAAPLTSAMYATSTASFWPALASTLASATSPAARRHRLPEPSYQQQHCLFFVVCSSLHLASSRLKPGPDLDELLFNG
jgi:hypothetical protein